MLDALETLAAAMGEPAGDDAAHDADIAPIFTYFGQFIDHDITANTDRDAPEGQPVSVVTGDDLEPLDRQVVVDNVMNLRQGALNLDSLYGEGPNATPFSDKVRNALRDSADRAKMRVGSLTPVGGDVPMPQDRMADLPRLGDVLDDPNSGLAEADIDTLAPGGLKDSFKKNGEVQRWRAMIGDGRNDENLLVAQVHLSFLRLHNAVAESLKPVIGDDDLRFDEARRRTTWYYQWLVLNAYLPAVCDGPTLASVKENGAPLYAAFRQRVAPSGPELPLPLEFSVAAFRFGHSMVRGSYDHNRNFGRPAAGSAQQGASFVQLFSFTGGDMLGRTITGQNFDRLPSNWPIEWDRFAKNPPDQPDHRARKIDTALAPPLADMLKEGREGGLTPEMKRILRHLAERNLRLGYRLNIPTGQAVVKAINAFDTASSGEAKKSKKAAEMEMAEPGATYHPAPKGGGGSDAIPTLSEGTLTSDPRTGSAIASGGFGDRTPLWFYVLKEAEETGGDRLGRLGSRLVAETLVGLVVQDPDSYWHQGSGDGSWEPGDLPIDGQVIGSMPQMLAACGLMAAPTA